MGGGGGVPVGSRVGDVTGGWELRVRGIMSQRPCAECVEWYGWGVRGSQVCEFEGLEAKRRVPVESRLQ